VLWLRSGGGGQGASGEAPVTGAGDAPLEWAARERQAARKGPRRRVLAWVGLNPAARRADALTARVTHGAVGEQWTAQVLTRLPDGWTVFYGRKLPGFVNDYDALLIPPDGDAVVATDTKRWHKGWETTVSGGRLYCGSEDRHDQVEKAVRAAGRLERAVAVPGVRVWPLLVVHGSRIVPPPGSPLPPGRLEVRAAGWNGVVHVLGPQWLVPVLAAASKSRDPERAAELVRRVDRVLPARPA
jgi:hypothetical protein